AACSPVLPRLSSLKLAYLTVSALSLPNVSVLLTESPLTESSTLSLHDALPIFDSALYQCFLDQVMCGIQGWRLLPARFGLRRDRSEEHTSELQSPYDLVCRLLHEKKKARRSVKQCPRHRQLTALRQARDDARGG